MKRKFIYLFLALALPALIFTFLKKFGKNEFSVPLFYEDGLLPDSVCDISVTGQYYVPDSIIAMTGINLASAARVIIIYPFIGDDLTEISRIKDIYATDNVDMIVLSGELNHPESKMKQTFLDFNDFGNIVGCIFRVEEPNSVILIDEKNRIRGYYDGKRRDEVDRLDLELSILLKKY